MTNYNLSNINDKEFEFLCRDLLQKELNIRLESFKKGRDKGIDLRYCKPLSKQTDLIVQAKHWFQSNFDKLLNHLTNEELPKVRLLNPKRYILVTSVGLLPQQKDEIKMKFEPYIETTGDIWGLEDINNRLNIHDDIAINHYKLWLTSSKVLLKILNNGIKSRSKFIAEEIEKNIRLFVPGQKYNEALKVLSNEKFLILTGEPGIGKTTLGNHLIFGLLAKDYELTYINENIKEAEDVFETEKNQVFYFDDFLGANYLELINPQNSDSSILNFIYRVSKSNNKLMILTTRTTILNRAMQLSNKFQGVGLDLKKHEIRISDYTNFDRARILYNHITYSGLPDQYREKITENKNYKKLIFHRNFNPRIIEFITEPNNLRNVKQEDYLLFIENNLEKPQLIWKHSYENQLDDYCRFLITTLFSLGNKVGENILKEAFLGRMHFEIEHNGFKKINNPYISKLKELLGSFMTRTFENHSYYCSFFNPSIVDFLINYLNVSSEEKWRIIESAIYIEQLNYRFSTTDANLVFLDKTEYTYFLDVIRKSETYLKSSNSRNESILLINLYCTLPAEMVEGDVLRQFKQIHFEDIRSKDFHEMILVLKNIKKFNSTYEIVIKNWVTIIFRLFRIASDESEFMNIKEIFEIYEIDYDEFSELEENRDKIQENIDYFWQINIDYIIEELKNDNITDIHDIERGVKWKLDEMIEFNNSFNIEESPSFDDLYSWDYEIWFKEMLMENMPEEEYYNRFEDLNYTDPYSSAISEIIANAETDTNREILDESVERPLSEEEKIDDLFSE